MIPLRSVKGTLPNTRMTLTQETLNLILSQIALCGTTLGDVVIMAMSCPGHGSVHDVSLHVENLLDELHGHELMHEKVSAWVHMTMKRLYTAEILMLTRPDAGLHYVAKGITEDKLCEFNIDNIIEQMSADAPLVWELLGELLSADPHLQYKRDWTRKQAQEAAAAKRWPHQETSTGSSNNHELEDVDMNDNTNLDDDEQYWNFFDESVPIVEEDEDEPEDIVDQVRQRRESKIEIVS